MVVATWIICDIITLLSLFALYVAMDINRDVQTRYKIVRALWNRKLDVFKRSNTNNEVRINKYKLNNKFKNYMVYRVVELIVLKILLFLISNIIINSEGLRLVILILASHIIINIIEMTRTTIKIVYTTVIKEDTTNEVHKSKCNG
ncbi:MAG: hypothetical protein J6A59_14220 [Lachnospiraceae bacterium]|nr:hypothetical protein [Lachnospiraceae bacterium]